MEDEG